MVRCQLVEAASAAVTYAVLAEAVDWPGWLARFIAYPRDVHDPLAKVQRRLDRVGQARSRGAAHNRTIHDHLDLVLATMAQLRGLIQTDGLAVDPDAGEARGAQLVPERIVALAVAPLYRRHHVNLCPFGKMQHLLNDLVGCLSADRQAAFRAVRVTQPRKENPEVVVDLGDRAHRRPRALARRLLLDADGGRKPADPLDLGLLQRGQKLTGVAGEALDVAALAFGIQRIDRERTLSRTAGPAADGHAVAGNVEVDPLQVVLPRSADLDRGQTLASGVCLHG